MYGYSGFPNPAYAGAEQAGISLVLGLAAFGLLLIMVLGMYLERI